MLGMLEHYCRVNWLVLPIDGTAFRMPQLPGLELAGYALSSKAPPYSPHRHDPHPEDNVGLMIRDAASGASVFYAPGLAEIEPRLKAPMVAADLLLIDGTCWTDNEMERRGVGTLRALQMGHLPQSGPGGMIEQLSRLDL